VLVNRAVNLRPVITLGRTVREHVGGHEVAALLVELTPPLCRASAKKNNRASKDLKEAMM
jgi:hypothetical protein